MSEIIHFSGLVNGKLASSYSPKKFNAHWGGAFTALEYVNLFTRLQKVPLGKSTRISIRRIGKQTEKIALKLAMQKLEMVLLSLDMNYLLINANKVNPIWIDKELPSQLLRFHSNSQDPTLLVGHALRKIGLNYWGVVRELAKAMMKYENELIEKSTSGNRSASVFFSI
jgi:hypothetical protein